MFCHGLSGISICHTSFFFFLNNIIYWAGGVEDQCDDQEPLEKAHINWVSVLNSFNQNPTVDGENYQNDQSNAAK